MLLNNELNSYLVDIDDECREKVKMLVEEMAKNENVPIYHDGTMNQLELVDLYRLPI